MAQGPTEVISFRLPVELVRELEARAEADGMSVSAYVRTVIEEHAEAGQVSASGVFTISSSAQTLMLASHPLPASTTDAPDTHEFDEPTIGRPTGQLRIPTS